MSHVDRVPTTQDDKMKGGSTALKATVSALRRARSDTEKFAALMVLTKAVSAESLNSDDLAKILNAVRVPFLLRLLRTNEAPEGCPPELFRSLGLELLGVFASDEKLSDVLAPTIEPLDELVSSDDDELSSQALSCAARFAEHHAGRRALVTVGLDSKLGAFLAKPDGVRLLTLLAGDPDVRLQTPSSLFRSAASAFQKDGGEAKFAVCRLLAALLARDDLADDAVTSASSDLRAGLRQALGSRLGSKMRSDVFELLAALVSRVGTSWALTPDDEPWALAVSLAAVEVRVQLEFGKPDVALLLRCFLLLEAALEGAHDLTSKRLLQLRGRVEDALAAVLGFVRQNCPQEEVPHGERDPLVVASGRLVCSWLSQDCSSLRPQLVQALPKLLHLASQEEQSLLPLLVPGLCHVTADPELRPLVLASPILQNLWRHLQASSGVALETACGVFLNVVVLEQDFVASAPTPFPELLGFCVRTVVSPARELQPVLRANLVVLGLFLLKLGLKMATTELCADDLRAFLVKARRFVKSPPGPLEDKEDATELCELRLLGVQVLQELPESLVPDFSD
ncbi:unnamed protein product [Ixodes pacificus]